MNKRIIPLLNILLLLSPLLPINSPLAIAASEESPAVNVVEPAKQQSEPAVELAVDVTEPVIEIVPEPAVATDDVVSEDIATEQAAIVTDAVSGHSAGAGLNDLLQVILSFVLVIGLLMFMLWGIKRWQPRLAPGRSGMSIKSVLSLGGRDRLIVVQAGERQILLGVSPGNINLLGDYDELLPPPPVVEQQEPQASAVDAFRKLLKR